MMAGLYSLHLFAFYSDKSRVTIDFSFLPFCVNFPPFTNGIVLDVVQMPIGGKGVMALLPISSRYGGKYEDAYLSLSVSCFLSSFSCFPCLIGCVLGTAAI